jgi:DNA-binding MurR/RpiR family transcriptional regulator
MFGGCPRQGSYQIRLTDAMQSPITKCSDLCLCLYATPSEINYFQAPLTSRITQLAVIDALFVLFGSEAQEQNRHEVTTTGEELLKRRFS